MPSTELTRPETNAALRAVRGAGIDLWVGGGILVALLSARLVPAVL